MKKTVKIILIILASIFCLVFLAIAGTAFVFRNEISVYSSIRQLKPANREEYQGGVYEITYKGNYYFNDYLKMGGVKTDKELTDFLNKKFTKGRKTKQIVGAVLYLACRRDCTKHLLIDFSVELSPFFIPSFMATRFSNVFNEFPVIIDRFFYFSNAGGAYSSRLLSSLYMIFFMIFALIYPLDERFNIKTKLRGFLIGFLIYFGVIMVQYLTWASVGAETVMNGVFSRYFIPLLIFVPLILNRDIFEYDKEKLSFIFLTIAISFISAMIILTVTIKY